MRSLLQSRLFAGLTCAATVFTMLSINVDAAIAASAAAPRAALSYDSTRLSPVLAHAQYLGKLDASQKMAITFTLPLQNQDQLKTLLGELQNPADPHYHHWLTSKQFAAQFGGNAADYQTVIAFAKSHGLNIVSSSPTRTILTVSGPESAVAAIFQTDFTQYKLASGRLVYTPTSTPTLPAELAGRVANVLGLDNAAQLHPGINPARRLDAMLRRVAPQSQEGTGVGGFYSPANLQQAYDLPTGYSGSSQTAAVFEQSGYNTSDILQFTQEYNLGTPNLVNVMVDGYDGTVQSGYEDEVVLDIDMILGFAPGIKTLYVYEGDPDLNSGYTPDWVDIFQKVADDDLASVLSVSYGESEQLRGNSGMQAENTIFTQMAAQGQSVFISSGDDGAYTDGTATPTVSDPASQPYVTAVGGTSLYVNSDGSYNSEVVWNDSVSGGGGASGGGVSGVWPMPAYQTAALGNQPYREVPDVSAVADPETGCAIYVADDGGWEGIGGTSMSCPLWAGYTVDLNDRLNQLGQNPLGQINPLLYPVASSPAYSTAFHDITSGNNEYYSAGPGYDLATGWGSYIGNVLLNQLVLPPSITSISPSSKTQQSTGFTLTITGTNLSTVDTVQFGSYALTPVTGSSTQLVVNVPAGAIATPGPVSVAIGAQGLASNSLTFTVIPLPSITSISPSGATAGDWALQVVLTGTFSTGDVVSFGGSILTPTALTSTSITVTVPATLLAAPATLPVFIVTSDNLSSAPVNFIVSAAPSLTSLSPSTVQAGHPPFALTLNGNGFVSGDTVTLGNASLTPTSITPTQVVVEVPTSDLVPPSVSVSLETPDGIPTASLPLTVTPAPSVTSVTPTTANAGSPQLTITVTGTGFVSTDQVLWNGTPLPTTYQSATTLTASVSASLLTTSGSFPVTVTTTAQGNSNAITFEVQNPVPSLTRLSPSSAAAGSAALTLTVTGTGFVSGATVEWNGAPISTTLKSATQLQATVPTTDLATAGRASVTVFNPAPGGGSSSAASFTITGVTTVYGLVTRTFDSSDVDYGTVTLTDSLGNQYQTSIMSQTQTDSSGKPYNYQFTDMPGGSFTAVAAASGYVSPSGVTVAVPGSGSVRQNLSLSSFHQYGRGLQMMSAPNDFSSQPIADALPDLGTSPVVSWNPQSLSYVFAPNSPANALQPGQGYWAAFNAPTDLVGPMTVIDPTQPYGVQLYTGWNMIGDPFPFAVGIGSMQSGSSSAPQPASNLIFSAIYTYDSTTQGYDTLSSTNALQPYVGYWVYAYNSGTLLIYPTTPPQ